MLLAILLSAASLADWVPTRWISSNPKSLDLLTDTPINCLLLERDQWSRALVEEAARRNIATLGVIRPSARAAEEARGVLEQHLTGLVLEGEFPAATVEQLRQAAAARSAPLIQLQPRYALRLEGREEILGTYQGVWPGLQVQEETGTTHAGPTGSPWINTNTGFLRFARAASRAQFWIGNLPPEKKPPDPHQYLHAICDAAMIGARWIVALDSAFATQLLAGDAKALQNWQRMGNYLRHFETHKQWRSLPPYGQLAVVQDADSGGLLAGGILDMIAVKHTPVRAVPRARLAGTDALSGARMAVNVDAEVLTPEQKEALRNFARGGGTLLTAPPGSKLPPPQADEITLSKEELEKIDNLWRGVNTMIGRENLGVRLFNVSAMLSHLLAEDGGKRLVLHLVNYTDYPVENITAQFPGKYAKATLITPESPGGPLEVFTVDGNTGVEIDAVPVFATLVIE